MIELSPETEKLIREEIQNGHYQTPDEIIAQGIYALRKKAQTMPSAVSPLNRRKNFYQFLMESPLIGSELNLERQTDYDRAIEL